MRASAEAAFAYLGDPANATTLDEPLISYEPDTNPMAPGTTVNMRFRAFGLPMSMKTRVREWEEGKHMIIDSLSPSRPFVATATHTFVAHPDGTAYTWAMEFRPNFPGGGVLARIASRFMRRAAAAQQQRFKTIMESSAP